MRLRRTSLGALLVHDTVTALFATDGLFGLDFVFRTTLRADIGHGGRSGLGCSLVVHG